MSKVSQLRCTDPVLNCTSSRRNKVAPSASGLPSHKRNRDGTALSPTQNSAAASETMNSLVFRSKLAFSENN